MATLRRVGVDDAARLMPLGEDGPVAVRFVPGLDALAYLRPEGGTALHSLWLHPLDGTPPRRLLRGEAQTFDREESLRRERARIVRDGVTAFQVAIGTGGGPVLLARTGRGLVRGGADGRFAPWPGLEGAGVEDGQLVAGGDRLLFARAGELVLADESGRAVVLDRAEADGVTVGLADYAAAEELGRQEGMWPSPDGRRIAYARVDERAVEPFEIVHGADAPPWTERIRYPFAGGPNATVELWLVDLEAADRLPTRLDATGPERYLARVDWTPTGELAALFVSRDQRHAAWHVYPLAGGAAQVVAEEGTDHWIGLPAGHRWRVDGTLLTTRERDGHTHLALWNRAGECRFLTRGDWDVTELCDLDESRAEAVVQITAALGRERHLLRVDLRTGASTALTSGAGCHSAVFAPDHGRFLVQVSSREHPTHTWLAGRDGACLSTIHEDPGAGADALGLTPPRLVEVLADDGTPLNGALYLPPEECARLYPAVVSVYGGPHAQRVREDWSLTADLRAQHLAQQGFVVFKLDNRGSDGRGPAFARALEGAFATLELDDQAAGVRFLVEHAGADPARIGVFGWSYGGFLSLHLLLRRPDLFAAAVSGAPVTDFARYDTAYTERHLGMPQIAAEVYARASVLPLAERLAGALLVIHGLVDENVHFEHTARLVQSLIDAGKAFELALLPTSRHLPRDEATRRFVERRTVGWLIDHLRPDRRPAQPG